MCSEERNYLSWDWTHDLTANIWPSQHNRPEHLSLKVTKFDFGYSFARYDKDS